MNVALRMNSPEVYFETGQKAGKARRNRDEATAMFMHDWFNRAVRLESKEYAAEARQQFNAGYKSEFQAKF